MIGYLKLRAIESVKDDVREAQEYAKQAVAMFLQQTAGIDLPKPPADKANVN